MVHRDAVQPQRDSYHHCRIGQLGVTRCFSHYMEKWHNRLGGGKHLTGRLSFFVSSQTLAKWSEPAAETSNGRSELGKRGSFTPAASLETLAFSSPLAALQRSTKTSRPGRKLPRRWFVVMGAYSRELLSVFAAFCLRINAPIRLQEPTEAMRLPQMNTCYSAPHRLCWRERGGEALFLHSTDILRSFRSFMKAKKSHFAPLRWYIQLHVLPINLASIRSKLKNFTSIHYHPSLPIGWDEHSLCSHWAVTDGGGTTYHGWERGGRRPQTYKTLSKTNMDKLPEFNRD